jgi:tetratricopeptide (TPR) repeat protein
MTDLEGTDPEAGRSRAAWIRTTQLLGQGRWDEARGWIGQFLSQHPEDPAHLRALTVCQLGMDRPVEARATLSRLFALEGPAPDLLRLQSRIDLAQGRNRDAFRSAWSAVAADPADEENHVALARVACAVQDWPRMEASLRQALALDAQHAEALHLLSVVLSVRGDHGESRAAARQLLSVDPESATGHSALGWTHLRQGEHKAAQEQFQESLRIDPSHPGARAGLLESLRARNLPYRLYLGWNHLLQGLSKGRQTLVIVGMLVAMQLLSHVRKGWPGILATLAVFLYFVFVMWTWMAPGFGNLLLLTDRQTRRLLHRDEKLSAVFVGGVFAGGVLACLSVFATFSGLSLLVGGTLLFSAIASSLWIENEHPVGRWVYRAAALAFPCIGIGALFGWTEFVGYLPESLLVLTLAGSFRILRR